MRALEFIAQSGRAGLLAAAVVVAPAVSARAAEDAGAAAAAEQDVARLVAEAAKQETDLGKKTPASALEESLKAVKQSVAGLTNMADGLAKSAAPYVAAGGAGTNDLERSCTAIQKAATEYTAGLRFVREGATEVDRKIRALGSWPGCQGDIETAGAKMGEIRQKLQELLEKKQVVRDQIKAVRLAADGYKKCSDLETGVFAKAMDVQSSARVVSDKVLALNYFNAAALRNKAAAEEILPKVTGATQEKVKELIAKFASLAKSSECREGLREEALQCTEASKKSKADLGTLMNPFKTVMNGPCAGMKRGADAFWKGLRDQEKPALDKVGKAVEAYDHQLRAVMEHKKKLETEQQRIKAEMIPAINKGIVGIEGEIKVLTKQMQAAGTPQEKEEIKLKIGGCEEGLAQRRVQLEQAHELQQQTVEDTGKVAEKQKAVEAARDLQEQVRQALQALTDMVIESGGAP